MACANCLHKDLVENNQKIQSLKDKFSKLALIAGWEEYAIIKCNCHDGYSWRPIKHPDVKLYGAVEYCVI